VQTSIKLALQNVRDIPETDVVAILHIAATPHLRQGSTEQDPDAMQVDITDAASIPTLAQVLALCVNYVSSAPALRLAFKQKFRGPENMLAVLEVLEHWLSRWNQKGVKLIADVGEVRKSAHGVLVATSIPTGKKSDLPALDKVPFLCSPAALCTLTEIHIDCCLSPSAA
jgi:hypothetical protein